MVVVVAVVVVVVEVVVGCAGGAGVVFARGVFSRHHKPPFHHQKPRAICKVSNLLRLLGEASKTEAVVRVVRKNRSIEILLVYDC